MNKQELLDSVKHNAALITESELLSAYHQGSGGEITEHHKFNLSDVLYYIGGGIVVLGIAILIGQNWERLGTAAQILVTLGSGIAAYVAGVLFSRYDKYGGPSVAFFLISAVVLPIGLLVTFDKMKLDPSSAKVQILTSALVFAVFYTSFFAYGRKILFTLFCLIFGTWLFQAVIQLMIGNNPLASDYKLTEYRVLANGLIYLSLGYYFSQTSQAKLTGVLYGFGSIMFLGAAMALGGYSPNQNAFWELIYPLLVFGIIFLSIYVKSRTFLVFGTLFLMGYIFKLTGEYFSQSLGWPLALVLAGLFLIAIGYYAVRISKKYLHA